MRFALVLGCAMYAYAGLHAAAETFTVNATFFAFQNENGCPPDCPDGSLTGTETINTVTGVITGSDLTATLNGSTYAFSGAPVSQEADPNSAAPDDPTETPNAYVAAFVNGPDTLDLNLSILGSLVGYTGGQICGLDYQYTTCSPGSETFEANLNGTYVNEGTLVPAASTPEPASLVLLVTGLASGLGFVRKRRA